jgi:hypothetical protein
MRWQTVGVTLVLGGLLATSGCSGGGGSDKNGSEPSAAETAAVASASASASPTPSVPATVLPTSFAPAASAGGICSDITYAEIQSALGLTFQISAANGKEGGVQTCVLLPVDGDAPALTLVSTPLDADESVDDYTTDLVPKGAKDQNGLGRAAYSRIVAASGDTGPTTELGWLGEETAYTLSVTFEPETGVPGATSYVPKMIALAPKLLG